MVFERSTVRMDRPRNMYGLQITETLGYGTSVATGCSVRSLTYYFKFSYY
jgi:hypothetical protein